MKRGELSMEVIIIAAIALLVLVILSVLLLRGGGGLGQGTQCGSVRGESCISDSSCPAGTDRSFHPCSQQGEICCISIDQQQS